MPGGRWFGMDEEGGGRGLTEIFRYLFRRLRKPTKELSPDNRCIGPDSKRAPQEYESNFTSRPTWFMTQEISDYGTRKQKRNTAERFKNISVLMKLCKSVTGEVPSHSSLYVLSLKPTRTQLNQRLTSQHGSPCPSVSNVSSFSSYIGRYRWWPSTCPLDDRWWCLSSPAHQSRLNEWDHNVGA
jgi:hypothetical protein